MNYCLEYKGQEYENYKLVEELNIDLTNLKNIERDLEEFCQEHISQRINLIISNYNEAVDKGYLPYIFDFQQEHKEFKIYIRLPYIDEEYYPALKEKYKDMKFYLNIYARDYDTIQGLIAEGVSDIYLTEEICFDIENAAGVAHSSNVRVRVFPNIAQSSWERTSPLKKFWIRPEDVLYYENLVDTFEFIGTPKQQNTLYDIYVKDKRWDGNLKNLIEGLNEDINSMCLLPRFGEKRVRCRHRCQQCVDCQMCNIIVDLSKKLEENKIRVKIDNNKEEEEQNG